MQKQGTGGRAKRVKPSMPVFGRKKTSKSQAATSTLISKWQAVQQVRLEAVLDIGWNRQSESPIVCCMMTLEGVAAYSGGNAGCRSRR